MSDRTDMACTTAAPWYSRLSSCWCHCIEYETAIPAVLDLKKEDPELGEEVLASANYSVFQKAQIIAILSINQLESFSSSLIE